MVMKMRAYLRHAYGTVKYFKDIVFVPSKLKFHFAIRHHLILNVHDNVANTKFYLFLSLSLSVFLLALYYKDIRLKISVSSML